MKRYMFIVILLFIACGLSAAPDTLTVQSVTSSGATVSLSAAGDDSLRFLNDDGKTTWIRIANTNGSSRTATIVSQASTNYSIIPAGLAATDASVTIPATTGDKVIGPFRTAGFNDSNDYVLIILSATADVTVQAYDMD